MTPGVTPGVTRGGSGRVRVTSEWAAPTAEEGNIHTGLTDMDTLWVRLVLNGINPGLSKSDFSPEFIPFGAKLTYFGPKSDIPDLSRPQKANFIMSLKRLAHNL